MLEKILITSVKNCLNIPDEIRCQAENIRNITESIFDESYIVFLDEQIGLNARGYEWTNRLKERKKVLKKYCNVRLLTGDIKVNGKYCSIKVDPATEKVIYWEMFDESY